jgi:hypothetical protein
MLVNSICPVTQMHEPNETCRVCGDLSPQVFSLQVLGRKTGYFDCKVCGYLQTQTPYWLDEAYAQAINDVDTGIIWRNRLNVGRVIMTLLAYGRLKGRVIDHAGGYGILVRMLRDAGVEAEWRDKYCQNLVARGFEATDGGCDLVTAFEVFEHMVNPVLELRQMLDAAPAVLVSTELVPTLGTPPPDWWYLGPEHGQHIGFFRLATFQWIAAKLGCFFASDSVSLHVFSRDPVPARWRLLQRWRRFWPVVAGCALTPKIVSDFHQVREKRLSIIEGHMK